MECSIVSIIIMITSVGHDMYDNCTLDYMIILKVNLAFCVKWTFLCNCAHYAFVQHIIL